jgi:WD40 repeat protein
LGEVLALNLSNALSVLAVSSGHEILPPIRSKEKIRDLAFSPDGRKLAVARAREVEVFDLAEGHTAFGPLDHETTVSRVAFSPDSSMLAACTSDAGIHSCYVQVWDSRTGRPHGGKLWHRDGVKDVAWFPDGRRLVAVDENGIGKIWSLARGRQIGEDLRHADQIVHVQLGAEANLVITASWDKSAQLWDGETGVPVSPKLPFSYALQMAVLGRESRWLIAREIGGDTWIRPVTAVEWSEPTLQRLANLLAARSPAPIAADEAQSAKALAREWFDLQATCSDCFSVAREDIITWHRFEAEQGRLAKLRSSELFHLNQLLRLVPDDRYSLARKKRVEAALASGEEKYKW